MNGGLPLGASPPASPNATGTPPLRHRSSPPPAAAPPSGWEEFCQRHAREAALDFARRLRSFLREAPARPGPPPGGREGGAGEVGASAYGRLFARHFVRSFEEEVGAGRRGASEGEEEVLEGGEEEEEEEEGGGSESSLSSPASPPSPAPAPAPARSTEELGRAPRLRKRFSLRSVGRTVRGSVRGILHWRGGGGGGEDSGHPHPQQAPPQAAEQRWTHRFERLRLARATPAPVDQRDVRREGLLHYAAADEGGGGGSGSGRNRWSKCRLLLRHTADGQDYQLEFYAPPK
ncbi:hypothetical protein chiPu_0028310, partial [Chiloscyllium punctatum]|nr:hypothetical protein [Chiloscyllium punctatum]